MPRFFTTCLLIFWVVAGLNDKTYCQDYAPLRLNSSDAPVNYHLSFDDDKFFKEDIIEQSGKKSLEERKIDFPDGRYGKGIRMREIPPIPDAINMTGIDLDLVTAVIFNTRPGNEMGFNQPFIWGSGRINARLGAVAFWVRGELSFAAPLFEQTSIGFGRKERDLLGITVNDANTVSAYVRDARYEMHEIHSETLLKKDQWNHVVLNWDWANGLQLWLNGQIIASSWGEDAWFETTLPGLFHLPAPGLTYDELYLFDRPLSEKEVKTLMKRNEPPRDNQFSYERMDEVSQRIVEASGSDFRDNLAVVHPDRAITISEVWPDSAGDGHVPGWFVMDGRNEIAWPHPYAMFTIIPGDADFHAEKVDIVTGKSAKVNYAVFTGQLEDVSLQSVTPRKPEFDELFKVPQGSQFLYASLFGTQQGATFRIPFTENYGTPEGFSGDINVPLSGNKRIQNIQLYYVSEGESQEIPGRKVRLMGLDEELDSRTVFAIKALTSRDERQIVLATGSGTGKSETFNLGAFSRLNLLSDAYEEPAGVKSITLSLPVRTAMKEETLFVRLRDPAVPSRFWNQFVVKLTGFDGEFKKLVLKIDFSDLVLAGGDRLWLDLGTAGETEVMLGDETDEAVLFIDEAPVLEVLDAYTRKELISAKAQYSKMYEFMPWQFTGKEVALNNPYCYGGPFDMLLPALAVHRVDPVNFEANFLIRMCSPEFKDGKPIHPDKMPLITLPNPDGAPEWALYMRDFNLKRHRMADWWAGKQNEDGQLGGGWNDDVLFLSIHQPDLPLDGNENARYLIDATHKGLEATRYFKNGYCNVQPMDRLHIGDFISERYNTLVNNLGQAYAYEREMESAWHLDKKDQTPVNYFADGFKSSVNVFSWYWGKDVPQERYVSKSLDELAEEFRLYTSVFDDYSFYRFTESNVHRDDYSPYGANNMYTYMLGGKRGTRLDAHLKLAVSWPYGGGPEMARVVLFAADDSLKIAAYSFEDQVKDLAMRLCRIESGIYQVSIFADPEGRGQEGTVLWQDTREINRFDVVELPIPPNLPVVIVLEQKEATSRPAELPDLALDLWDVQMEGNTLECTIHNLGNGPAKDIKVRVMDGDAIIQEEIIEEIAAPTDFVAKREKILFKNISLSGNLHIVLDPENEISEILEENNEIPVFIKPDFTQGLEPKKN